MSIDIKDYSRVIMEYVDPEKNSSKFYSIEKREKSNWIAAWGRRGSAPQGKKVYEQTYMIRKVQEKLRKGYKIVHKENSNGRSAAFNDFLRELGDGWDFPD